MQQYFQLMIIANRMRQIGQSLIILLEYVRAQLDMLSQGHLSPSVVTSDHLRELLLRIQTELPQHYRLPVDPVRELSRYYCALAGVTILEDSKLLAYVSVPLLERGSMYEIYEVINIPSPYPWEERKCGIVTGYKVETEFIALIPERTKFMLLSREEANWCNVYALETGEASSPIYVGGSHRLRVIELFKGDKKGIEGGCQRKVLTNAVLSQLIGITDWISALATRMALKLSEVCEEEPSRSIIISPLTMAELPMKCSESGMALYRPQFYQIEEKFEERKVHIELINWNLSGWGEVWEPLTKKFSEVTLRKMPELLELPGKINFGQ